MFDSDSAKAIHSLIEEGELEEFSESVRDVLGSVRGNQKLIICGKWSNGLKLREALEGWVIMVTRK